MTALGEAERWRVDRLRCILLSQAGDLALGLEVSSADRESGDGEGDSRRRLLNSRNRSRFMVLARVRVGL